MRRWTSLLAFCLAVVVIVLTTCGGDGEDASSTTAVPATSAESTQPSTTATTAPPPDSTEPTAPPRSPTSTDIETDSSGPPPWAAEHLDLATLPAVYELEWAEAGEPDTCPFLAFADLGPEAADATIRRAENDREMLVVWDNPDGPGHDRRSEPCDDCGRGVVGLGTFQPGGHVGDATIAWDEGSVANIAELPWVYGISARIQPAGADCIYQLWSHIGHEHLRYLIGQLRQVDR